MSTGFFLSLLRAPVPHPLVRALSALSHLFAAAIAEDQIRLLERMSLLTLFERRSATCLRHLFLSWMKLNCALRLSGLTCLYLLGAIEDRGPMRHVSGSGARVIRRPLFY